MDTKVIVLGRNFTSRLGMIRAAGIAGYQVIVIKTQSSDSYKKEKIDQNSKYVCGYYCAPEPNEDELISVLKEKCVNKSTKNIIIPTDDYTASVIDRRQKELENDFLFPHIDHEPGAVVRYMNKELQKELAKKAGLNVAKGWNAKFDGNKFLIPEDVIFPCFVKPRISFEGSKFYMKRCDSREELERHLDAIASDLAKKGKKTDLLIEEFIKIEKEYAVLGYCDEERVILPDIIEASFMHRGGVTAKGIISDLSTFPELGNKLKQFVSGFHFCGLFDIDLYLCNGTIYFCEMNFRFGASGYAVTNSGINLPGHMINYFLNRDTGTQGIPVIPTKTFASEKVCYQEYHDRVLDWKSFRSIIKDSDFSFIKNADDPEPGKVFWRRMHQFHIKRIIKDLMHRK